MYRLETTPLAEIDTRSMVSMASAVSRRMITLLISADRGKKADLAGGNIVHLQKNHPTLCRLLLLYFNFILYVKPIRSSLLIQRKPAGSSFRLHA